jgi:hypothetical protein
MRALEARMARTGSLHAMDLSAQDIVTTLNALYQDQTAREAALICAFMWLTGVRCEDLSWIYRGYVALSERSLRVEMRWAKNIRTTNERVELRIPVEWLPMLPRDLSEALSSRICRGAHCELLFPGASTEYINRSLRRVWPSCGIAPTIGTANTNLLHLPQIVCPRYGAPIHRQRRHR